MNSCPTFLATIMELIKNHALVKVNGILNNFSKSHFRSGKFCCMVPSIKKKKPISVLQPYATYLKPCTPQQALSDDSPSHCLANNNNDVLDKSLPGLVHLPERFFDGDDEDEWNISILRNNRRCTDVHWLCIFLLYLAGMVSSN